MLTRDELEKYDRQIMLGGFGEEGQWSAPTKVTAS